MDFPLTDLPAQAKEPLKVNELELQELHVQHFTHLSHSYLYKYIFLSFK